jgi:DNA replication protein DnaC
MSYNKIAYANAERELKRRAADAEESAKERFEEAIIKAPELAEIDRAFKSHIMDMTKLIFTNRSDASEKIDKIKAELDKGNALKAEILHEAGLPEDYLKVRYTCEKCSDTGFVGDVRCECFIKLIGKFSADELNRTANLPKCDFAHFSTSLYSGKTKGGLDISKIMENNYKTALKYANEFKIDSDSLFIYGKTGLGKTHISLAIAKRVLEKGFSVVYCSVANIVEDIRKERFGNSIDASIEQGLIDVDLLVLDDLGAEHVSSYTESILYNIINSRMNLQKPTIINCNFDLEDFNELTDRYNDRIVSRITAYYKRMRFVGSDIRQIKRK